MKRTLVSLVVLALAAFTVSAQGSNAASFDAVVDFDASIKAFAAAANGGPAPKADRFALLVGTVGSVIKRSTEPVSYAVELVSGEWIGMDDVKTFHLYLEYSGDAFTAFFDRKAGLAKPGARVLVVCKFSRVAPGPDGAPAVWLTGHKLKVVN